MSFYERGAAIPTTIIVLIVRSKPTTNLYGRWLIPIRFKLPGLRWFFIIMILYIWSRCQYLSVSGCHQVIKTNLWVEGEKKSLAWFYIFTITVCHHWLHSGVHGIISSNKFNLTNLDEANGDKTIREQLHISSTSQDFILENIWLEGNWRFARYCNTLLLPGILVMDRALHIIEILYSRSTGQ